MLKSDYFMNCVINVWAEDIHAKSWKRKIIPECIIYSRKRPHRIFPRHYLFEFNWLTPVVSAFVAARVRDSLSPRSCSVLRLPFYACKNAFLTMLLEAFVCCNLDLSVVGCYWVPSQACPSSAPLSIMPLLLLSKEQSNVQSTKQDLVYSVVPLLKLICLTVIGLILGHPKTQLVPRATFKLLSKLVFALFLPCLIFIHLGETVTLRNFVRWWFVPVNVILSTIIGALLGLLVAKVCKPPPEYIRFTVMMTAFGNTGNLHLAIIGSVCHGAHNPFGPACQKTGTAYVSFAQWVAVLILYTLVYHLMDPPFERYEVVDDGIEIQELSTNDLNMPLLLEAELPAMDKASFIARSSLSRNSVPEPDLLEEGGSGAVSHIFQPPIFATILAFIVGMVPPIKSVVYGNDAPLSFITDSLEILAGAMVPSVMLILGGMLAEGPNESRLGIRTTIGIIVARLLILPLAGLGVVSLADRLKFLIAGDQMYRFVLLLQYTTPSAILLGAIASLRGYAASEASALLFWQHIFAVFSLTIYVIILLQDAASLCLSPTRVSTQIVTFSREQSKENRARPVCSRIDADISSQRGSYLHNLLCGTKVALCRSAVDPMFMLDFVVNLYQICPSKQAGQDVMHLATVTSKPLANTHFSIMIPPWHSVTRQAIKVLLSNVM
ncbi:protein PIN-LIKES 2 [Sesamum angolense]|uniref:Protein PIN-LIKES 2 n=1 Tax=Sesamum angolense TaxID=2727404 RepID=A0AAE1XE37_9LAMI|nr:protein PIN-LIKES 2 [Sesamum angolense]